MENKIKVFVDTNIIITGIFFSGYEVLLINLSGIKLFTADVCIEEARKVVERSSFEEYVSIALEKLENTFVVLNAEKEGDYSEFLPQAKLLIPNKPNDQKVLAAALYLNPDYFVSRDGDFDKKNIKQLLNIKTAEEILYELGVI